MKKLKCMIFLFLLVKISFSFCVDTSKLFWNNFLYLDYSYGWNFLFLRKINKYYIDDFGKFIFKKNPHWVKAYYPTFGLPIGNSILSASYYRLNLVFKGELVNNFEETETVNLYLDYYSLAIDYRRCFKFNNYILLNPGITTFFGKAYSYVGSEFFYELNKEDDALDEALGGGIGLFIEGFCKTKALFFGPRVGFNFGFTGTLKNRYSQEWIVYTNNQKINMGLSGFYLVLKAGILL